MHPIGPKSGRAGAMAVAAGLPLAMRTGLPAVAHADPMVATITVDTANPGPVIPADLLGLSFEANLMHEQWLAPGRGGNVPTLLANLGQGNMRFSANQVDRTAWIPTPETPVPGWANGQVVTLADLSRVDDLARHIGWSVDMGVNLGHFDPASAADQARSAQERIGGSLRSVQIGNEPNLYIAARPNANYYAALAFSELAGGTILPTTVAAGDAHISALAVRMPDGQIKVLIANLDRGFRGDIEVKVAGEQGAVAGSG